MRFNLWSGAAATAVMLMLASPDVYAQQSCTLKDRKVQLPLESSKNAGPPPIGPYEVLISINGGPSKLLQVDTGSTGIVVPFTDVPLADWNKTTRLGEIFYSSDNVYHPGKIVTVPLRMGWWSHSKTWAAEVSSIDILAAQCTCTVQEDPNPKPAPTQAPADCSGYVGTKANVAGHSRSIVSCKEISRGFGMMGVGYDRGAPTAKNPFLRLTEMDQGTMSPGYEITSTGITLGVTEAMLKGYKLLQLQSGNAPKIEAPSNPREWQAPSACATFPRSGTNYSLCGTVLPDTGITYMMLTQASRNQAPTTLKDTRTMPMTVPPRTEMTVTVGPSTAPALQYTYKTGEGPPAPVHVQWRGPIPSQAHINTGRFILAAADYVYDAACGRVGFRAVTPSTSQAR